MRRMTKPRRGGFTLVELLTVVAILGLLAALATAAFLRARGGAEVSATEATLSKLKSGLDRRWKAVLDNARDEMGNSKQQCKVPEPAKTNLYAFAGEDHDRAKVIWTYCKLKNEFPTTLAEACNPVYIPNAVDPVNGLPAKMLDAKSVFVAGFKSAGLSNVVGVTDPPDLGKEKVRMAYESAACFYWALTATADRGETFEGDGTAQQAGELPYPLTFGPSGAPPFRTHQARVFKDAWGSPIAFLRQGYTPGEGSELNKTPFTRGASGTNRDPLDPLGKLLTPGAAGTLWQPTNVQTLVDQFWAKLNLTPHATLDGTVFTAAPLNQYPRTVASPPSGAWNWVPTLVSAGSDHKDAGFSPNLGQGDDLLSFRLAREGNRGN